jgi:uncharacterized protein (TIGR00290 family)
MVAEPVVFAWSGGKDGMLALHELQEAGMHRVVALLTTVNADHDRVTMHGVRRDLLVEQANSLGYPLRVVDIPADSSDGEYRERMSSALLEFRADGIRSVVHGDIFLADVREYRERMLDRIGLSGLFPLWGESTPVLANRFIDLGYRAVVTCVDTHALDRGFSGLAYDAGFIRRLPDQVDPCGEKGEFHTFVHDGPLFRRAIAHTVGEVVLRDGRFAFCDLLPSHASPPPARTR